MNPNHVRRVVIDTGLDIITNWYLSSNYTSMPRERVNHKHKRGGQFPNDPHHDPAKAMNTMSNIKLKLGALTRQSLGINDGSDDGIVDIHRSHTDNIAESKRKSWLKRMAEKAASSRLAQTFAARQKRLYANSQSTRNTPEQDAQLRDFGLGGSRKKRRSTRMRRARKTRRKSRK